MVEKVLPKLLEYVHFILLDFLKLQGMQWNRLHIGLHAWRASGQPPPHSSSKSHVLQSSGTFLRSPQTELPGVIPDGFPGIVQHVTQGLVIGLAGDHTAIRFNAHIIEGSRAAFYPKLQFTGSKWQYWVGVYQIRR